MSTKTSTKAAAPVTDTKAGDTPVHSPELDGMISAVRTAVKTYNGKMKARDTATQKALVAKVEACRAIITLMADPATFAARGPKAGKPSVTIIAELVGEPRQSFTPLFKGAEALRDYYATLTPEALAAIYPTDPDTAPAAPTEAETDLASVGLASEAERSRANRLKAKQGDTGTGSTGSTGGTDTDTDGDTGTAVRTAETPLPTYDNVVAATLALQEIVKGYCREAGFSGAQGDNLQGTLAEIAALIETHKVDGGDS